MVVESRFEERNRIILNDDTEEFYKNQFRSRTVTV